MSYGVLFNALDGNGTTKQQIIENGVETELAQNTFHRASMYSPNGYDFMGWSATPFGEVILEDRQAVLDLAPNGSLINLYAVWEKTIELGHSYILRPLAAAAIGTVEGDTIDTEDYAMAADITSVLHIYSVDEMGDAGTKTITQNGIYNAKDDNWGGYSSVTVEVPIPQYANADVRRY